MTKATTADGDQLQRSVNWVLSRRGILKVYDDRLEYGNWTIPYADMTEAVLFSVSQSFIPGYVLRVTAGNAVYHFGLNWNPYWKRQLPFPVVRQKAQLGYSRFSVALRIAVVVLIAYWIWQRTRQ